MKTIKKFLLYLVAPLPLAFAPLLFWAVKFFVPVGAADKLNNYSSLVSSFDKPNYPINKNGQSYGETFNVMVEDYPDLIGVIASNGKEGYAYKNDLLGEYVPQSPEEAVEYMKVLEELNNQGIYFQLIPVYESDGETVIGEFEICLDVGDCFSSASYASEADVLKAKAEREKLYEESRAKGKYLREDLKTVMAEAMKNR